MTNHFFNFQDCKLCISFTQVQIYINPEVNTINILNEYINGLRLMSIFVTPSIETFHKYVDDSKTLIIYK